MAGLFDLFDAALAEELGVDVETYIRVIESVEEEDAKYIINTIMDEHSTQEDLIKVREFFKTKI